MAWWYARFLFEADRLLDVGVHDSVAELAEVVDDAGLPTGDPLTSVLVSGYSLYGRLRGYYALGVGQFRLVPATGRLYGTPEALRHGDATSELSDAQRATLSAWLRDQSPEAWATSLASFRRALGEDAAAEPATASVRASAGESASAAHDASPAAAAA